MRIGKPIRATRSKATTAVSAPGAVSAAAEEHHDEEVAKNNSADTAQSDRGAAEAAEAALILAELASEVALTAAAVTSAQVSSEVRRTPRKRSKTKLYDAKEAAGAEGSKRQKRSARLASKERGECPNPLRDEEEEEPDDVPPSPRTEESAPPFAAVVGKTDAVIHLSGKNMATWNRLRKEFRVQNDDKVFERLLSSLKPGFIQKKAKQELG